MIAQPYRYNRTRSHFTVADYTVYVDTFEGVSECVLYAHGLILRRNEPPWQIVYQAVESYYAMTLDIPLAEYLLKLGALNGL